MSTPAQGPWTKYAQDQGPWSKYQQAPEPTPVASALPQPSLVDRLTEIQKPDPNHPWSPREAVKAVGNIGAGAMTPILHPIDTLAGVGGLITAPFEKLAGSTKPTVYEDIAHSLKENPYGAIEGGIGQAATIGGAGKAVGAAADAVPSAARAGGVLQDLRTSLANTPVETHPAMVNAQRIGELAERGGSAPKFAAQYIERNMPKIAGEVVTQQPSRMTFPEARDFYSNASRLSAAENMGTNPTIHREVGQFTNNLGKSIQDAANAAGKGDEYAAAMREYRQAKNLEEALGVVKKYGLRTFLGALGGYGAYKAGSEIFGR